MMEKLKGRDSFMVTQLGTSGAGGELGAHPTSLYLHLESREFPKTIHPALVCIVCVCVHVGESRHIHVMAYV